MRALILIGAHCSLSQILDVDPDGEEEGAAQDLDSMRKGKCAVIKTSTRQTVFLPLIGLVPAEKLKPGDLIGVNKDSYLILDTLPAEFDSRVKAMEVDERPTETYTDIGGLEKQIEELVEAIVLPMEQADKFKTLGITPPKGCLMYGPPGMSFYLWVHPSLRLMILKVRERLCLPGRVPLKQRPVILNSLALPLFKCSSVMAPNSSVTPSSLRKRNLPQSSLLTSWTPLGQNGLILRRVVTVRCSGQCWSC